jgi:hypothetical protein
LGVKQKGVYFSGYVGWGEEKHVNLKPQNIVKEEIK